jgi:hypothetical protein
MAFGLGVLPHLTAFDEECRSIILCDHFWNMQQSRGRTPSTLVGDSWRESGTCVIDVDGNKERMRFKTDHEDLSSSV